MLGSGQGPSLIIMSAVLREESGSLPLNEEKQKRFLDVTLSTIEKNQYLTGISINMPLFKPKGQIKI